MLWWIIKGLLPWDEIFKVAGVWIFFAAYFYFLMWRGVMKQDYDCGACIGNSGKYTCIGAWILFSSICTLGVLSSGH